MDLNNVKRDFRRAKEDVWKGLCRLMMKAVFTRPVRKTFFLAEEESTGFKQGLKAIQEGFEVDN